MKELPSAAGAPPRSLPGGEPAKPGRGRLKIFLGYAAGVGKTYRMLSKAALLREGGSDIVIGVVETHGRAETEMLLSEMEMIPRRTVHHQGLTVGELDLDAVLRRSPAYVLVDELAHTNAPGSRHEKRWQDVEEILAAGIHVYTTFNIQHTEGLHDIVRQITGIDVRETVPDRVVEKADEIELVDLPPAELLERLRQGKVYIPERAREATLHFFTEGNLLALRELALRSASQHVSADVHAYLEENAIDGPWDASARIAVCVGDGPRAERLLRVGHRLARSLNAVWFAVHVDLPSALEQGMEEKLRLEKNLELASELGATVVRLSGRRIADEVASFARAKNVSLIIVGSSRQSVFRRLRKGSPASQIIRRGSPAQVLVTGGFDRADEAMPRSPLPAPRATLEPYPIATSVLGLIATVFLCNALRPYLSTFNLAMVYLLFVAGSAIVTNMWTGIVFAAVSVVAFDFFTIPPYYSFSVNDLQYVPGLAVMFLVGVAINVLAETVHRQARASKEREAFMAQLSDFNGTLLRAHTFAEVLGAAMRSISELFDCDAVFLLPDNARQLQPVSTGGDRAFDEHEKGVAAWVFHNRQPAGFQTNTLAASRWHHVPLVVGGKSLGVLAILPHVRAQFGKDRQRLLHAYVSVISLALLNSPTAPQPDFLPQ